MRLGIVIHGHRPDAMAAAHHAVAQLASCGAQVLVEDEVLAAFASGSVTSLNAPDARADVILSLGGDGTLLRGAQYALSWDAALLGVNLGRVGFLAEGEADALPRLLDKVIRGDYETERRAVLSVQMNGQSWYAINDVVMSRGGYARLITVTALVDGALAPGITLPMGLLSPRRRGQPAIRSPLAARLFPRKWIAWCSRRFVPTVCSIVRPLCRAAHRFAFCWGRMRRRAPACKSMGRRTRSWMTVRWSKSVAPIERCSSSARVTSRSSTLSAKS